MTPIKVISNFGKAVLGGTKPVHIFAGCLFGVLAGMMPGVNLTLLIAVLLLVIFNVNAVSAAAGVIAGRYLRGLVAQHTFRIGCIVIHEWGLDRDVPGEALDLPGLPWMGFQRYCLLGGIPIAIAAGLILGLVVACAVGAVRRRIARPPQGAQQQALDQSKDPKDWVVRKWGFVASGAAIVVFVLAGELFAFGWIARAVLARGMQRAFGAEVNIAGAHASLFKATVEFEGIQITDPDKPTHNMMHVEKLSGGINMRELLRKRLVIDKMHATTIETDTPRKSPGKVYDPGPCEIAAAENYENDPGRYIVVGEDLRKYQNYLKRIRKWLKARHARTMAMEHKSRKERAIAWARDRGYLATSAADVCANRSAWAVRQLEVDQFTFKRIVMPELKTRKRYGEGAKRKIELEPAECRLVVHDLSGNPELDGKPVTFAAAAGGAGHVSVAFGFTKPRAGHKADVYIRGIPLGKALSFTDAVPVTIAVGKLDLRARGEFSGDSMRIPVTLSARGMTAYAREGEEVLGLEPELAKEVFENLTQATVNVLIEGPIDAPELKVNRQQIISGLKSGLIRTRRLELFNRFNAALMLTQGEFAGKFKHAADPEPPPENEKQAVQDKPDDKHDKPKDDLPEGVGDLLEIPF